MLFDRRRIGRTTVVQPAKIVETDTGATNDCIVDNLTTLGACISVNAAITGEMPKNFDLTFDNCHTFCVMPGDMAKQKWRAGRCDLEKRLMALRHRPDRR
jgi:hypothetical protein